MCITVTHQLHYEEQLFSLKPQFCTTHNSSNNFDKKSPRVHADVIVSLYHFVKPQYASKALIWHCHWSEIDRDESLLSDSLWIDDDLRCFLGWKQKFSSRDGLTRQQHSVRSWFKTQFPWLGRREGEWAAVSGLVHLPVNSLAHFWSQQIATAYYSQFNDSGVFYPHFKGGPSFPLWQQKSKNSIVFNILLNWFNISTSVNTESIKVKMHFRSYITVDSLHCNITCN